MFRSPYYDAGTYIILSTHTLDVCFGVYLVISVPLCRTAPFSSIILQWKCSFLIESCKVFSVTRFTYAFTKGGGKNQKPRQVKEKIFVLLLPVCVVVSVSTTAKNNTSNIRPLLLLICFCRLKYLKRTLLRRMRRTLSLWSVGAPTRIPFGAWVVNRGSFSPRTTAPCRVSTLRWRLFRPIRPIIWPSRARHRNKSKHARMQAIKCASWRKTWENWGALSFATVHCLTIKTQRMMGTTRIRPTRRKSFKHNPRPPFPQKRYRATDTVDVIVAATSKSLGGVFRVTIQR